MSLEDSIAAYEKAGHAAVYHWWSKREAIAGLQRLLAKLEAAGNDARLCCHRGLKENGEATLWLSVEGADVKALGNGDDDPLDLSHPCPPFCS